MPVLRETIHTRTTLPVHVTRAPAFFVWAKGADLATSAMIRHRSVLTESLQCLVVVALDLRTIGCTFEQVVVKGDSMVAAAAENDGQQIELHSSCKLVVFSTGYAAVSVICAYNVYFVACV